jgi:MYXO-CTERM domain-containing protein
MKLHTIVTAAFLASTALVSHAALITWGAASNITGDADVSTTGSLVGAFNLGNTGVASATVNGVLFQSLAVPSSSVASVTIGNFALTSPNDLSTNNTFYGSPVGPFSTLSASYQTLLGSGLTALASGTDLTLTMSGLSIGAQYQFQWFSNLSLPGSDTHTAAGVPSGGGVVLADNTSAQDGGMGQFALGSFTADATTQVIAFDGPTYALINGFQLREVEPAPAPVPEPGTALAGLALLGLVGVRRRRRAA